MTIAGALIQNSDERLKTDISDLSPAEIRAALAIKTRRYSMKDGDGKQHFGVIAQEVIAAFADQGLDARDYAIVRGEGTAESPFAVAYSQLEALRFEALRLLNNALEKRTAKLEAYDL